MKQIIFYITFLSICGFTINSFALNKNNNTVKTTAYFETIKSNSEELLIFLKSMPKGGDLHMHLGGAAYAENLISYGMRDNFCINPNNNAVTKQSKCPRNYLLQHLPEQAQLYNKIIDAWSMRNFFPRTTPESGHDHFFNTFNKFALIVSIHHGKILAEVTERAAKQHESYLELMMLPDNNASGLLGLHLGWDNNFENMRKQLLEHGLKKFINASNQTISTMQDTARHELQCNTANARQGCDITVKYLYLILRNQPPAAVFAQILLGFELASKHKDVVGINLVQSEDGVYSLKDYRLHMRMINYLKQIYPNVHVSLHAGELALGLVPPKNLTFHITDAVKTARAERIGHGVDIAYEKHSKQLLNTMAKKHIMVEINLTSNANILNIKGKHHPLPLYLHHHVPVALSTDDEGVLRTDLTHEYQRAVSTYDLPYQTIKQFARNSLTYSFLPGKSLWEDADKQIPVNACKQDMLGDQKPAKTCQKFLANSQKAQAQWKLEKEFNTFEKKYD